MSGKYDNNEKDQKRSFSFNLELLEEDYIDVCKLAGSHGISVEELLQNFINDLICSDYSNGSDERMYARQYFDRCSFGMFPEQTFLSHLIEFDGIEDFVQRYGWLKEYGEELQNLHDVEKENLLDEIEFQKENLREYYDDYVSYKKNPESYEDGVATVMAWWNDLNSRMDT